MKTIVNGKYGQYTVYERCIAIGYKFFNNVDEIERYRYFRALSGLKPMDNILNEAIRIMKIKGLAVKTI